MNWHYKESIRRALALLALTCSTITVQPANGAEAINITIDFAKLYSLERKAATIIVGNPGIADVSLHDETTLVLTGRAAGTTNLIVLNSDDEEIANAMLRVATSSADVTTVYYGNERQSFSCSPTCEQIISIGDGDEAFRRAVGQIESRNEFSRGSR